MRIYLQSIRSRLRLAQLSAPIVLFIVTIVGCSTAFERPMDAEHDALFNKFSFDGLTITNVMATEVPIAGGNGAIYLTLHSEVAETLVSAATPSAALTEFHESINDNGIMRMEPRPDGFEIQADKPAELKRGGKHIMLIGVADTLTAGDAVEITLTFRNHGPVTLMVPVKAISKMPHDEIEPHKINHD